MSAVLFTVENRIATLTLDNPAKLNALTPGMLGELSRLCDVIEADASILGVILSASPSRAFCAGADINAWSDVPPQEFARHWVRGGHRVVDRLARLSKPTIAAINGHAFGGGLELAAACDIRVIAPAATLALPEAGVGIVPGWSGTQRLARLLPEPVLREVILFGRRLSAERALALGFVAEIAEEPLAAARAIAGGLANTSPCAVEVAKYMINAAVGEDAAAMVEALGSGMIAATADKQEGVAAFRAKRKPQFPGA
ncbi:MAG: enoyl-CoA hydratase/isomerase family protein [Rhizobiaceae bacterium]|nr:enoyl-CoA hydratase/isomerase family protein [Rhizobiaceae bacterium]